MAKYQWHNPEVVVHKSKLTGSLKAFYDEADRAIESLVKEGLLVTLAKKGGLNGPAAI